MAGYSSSLTRYRETHRLRVFLVALPMLFVPECTARRRPQPVVGARSAPSDVSTTSPRIADASAHGTPRSTPNLPLPEPRPGRVLRNLFGVSSKFAQGEPAADLGLLLELGVNWVRDSVPWPEMEPSRGQYADFPPDFRRRLEFYKTHDIGLVFMLAYDNPTAYAPTANAPAAAFEPTAYGRWAVHVAQRLRDSGVRFVLELWNEPHNMVLRPVLGGAWNGVPPSPWVRHYVQMVHEAVKQVKQFDPRVRVIDDDDMWVLHYWFLESGLPPRLDGFAFHPYVPGIPERTAIDQKTPWVAPFVLVDPDSSFASAVRRLRERGQAKLAHQPELWITEWGWPVGEPGGKDQVFPEDAVAAWLPRAFVLAEAGGVEALCWFSTQDNVDGPMGLTDNSGRKRKAYFAYKALNESLGNYTYLGQISGARHQTSGVQAYLFHRGSHAKLVAWSIEPTVSWLELVAPLQSARVSDNFNQPVTPVPTERGVTRVRLAASPIYVDFDLPNKPFQLHLSDANSADSR